MVGGSGRSALASIRRRASLAPASRSDSELGAVEVGSGELAVAQALGLYVHFPFCGVHCPYCDFAVDARADIPHDGYAGAVVSEIEARAAWFGWNGSAAGDSVGPPLVSVYFGGGTPGLWRPAALASVIAAATRTFGVADCAALEITVEANPGETDEATLRSWRRAGVNRLSLGLQALDDRLLRAIGRNHDAAAGPAAVRAARAAGIDNLSIDLMFGLPGQSFDDWRYSVEGVLALSPEHVSAYALTIERGTVFGARSRKGELVVPDDALVAGMQEWVREALRAAGLAQYEVSSYARPGRRAVHNALYWTGAPYLGVGASASSFRPLRDGGGWRFSNPRATDTYLRAARAASGSLLPAQFEKRTGDDLENEAVWLALRTSDGLDRATHARRFGSDPVATRSTAITRCIESGWLVLDAQTLRPTATGLLFADEIAARLWR